MGNSMAKAEPDEQQLGSSTSTPPLSQSQIIPRKHSTVSTARLFLCGEKLEYLTEEQKGHIRVCWKRIEDDVASVGVITFMQRKIKLLMFQQAPEILLHLAGVGQAGTIILTMLRNHYASHICVLGLRLFETHPDVKEVFMPFNGIQVEELRHSKQLRAHALRVMAFVQKAVARLDEREKLDKLLEELGKNHFYYGAPKKYIDYIGPQFIKAIEPSLEDIWKEEVKEAWVQLFKYISYRMKESLTLAEKTKRGSK